MKAPSLLYSIVAGEVERRIITAIICPHGEKLDLRVIARDLHVEVMPQGFLNAIRPTTLDASLRSSPLAQRRHWCRCRPTGSNALIPAGTAAALVPICTATGVCVCLDGDSIVPGWMAGHWCLPVRRLVSVCATAVKAARMKTKRTLKLFMMLPILRLFAEIR